MLRVLFAGPVLVLWCWTNFLRVIQRRMTFEPSPQQFKEMRQGERTDIEPSENLPKVSQTQSR